VSVRPDIKIRQSYSLDLPAALAFFHLALAIAASFALTAALILRFAFLAGAAEALIPYAWPTSPEQPRRSVRGQRHSFSASPAPRAWVEQR
jgi:hypothetical protein